MKLYHKALLELFKVDVSLIFYFIEKKNIKIYFNNQNLKKLLINNSK
jgi:hypothetical protein